jgi:hypothetical protein
MAASAHSFSPIRRFWFLSHIENANKELYNDDVALYVTTDDTSSKMFKHSILLSLNMKVLNNYI